MWVGREVFSWETLSSEETLSSGNPWGHHKAAVHQDAQHNRFSPSVPILPPGLVNVWDLILLCSPRLTATQDLPLHPKCLHYRALFVLFNFVKQNLLHINPSFCWEESLPKKGRKSTGPKLGAVLAVNNSPKIMNSNCFLNYCCHCSRT